MEKFRALVDLSKCRRNIGVRSETGNISHAEE